MHRTIHQIISLSPKQSALMSAMCDLQNKVGRKMLAAVFKNNAKSPKLISQLTSFELTKIQKEYGLLSRHANSLNRSMQGQITSYVECQKLNFKNLKDDLCVIEEKISLNHSKLDEIQKTEEFKEILVKDSLDNFEKNILFQLPHYQQYLKDQSKFLKHNKRLAPYPYDFVFHYDRDSFLRFTCHRVLTSDKKNIFQRFTLNAGLIQISEKYGKLKNDSMKLNQKKLALHKKISKIQSDIDAHKIRICLGGKKLLAQRHKLKNLEDFIDFETGVFDALSYENYFCDRNQKYKTLNQWQKDWKNSRSNQFMLTGEASAKSGNQSCIASYEALTDSFSLNLRLPYALTAQNDGLDYLICDGIRFHGKNHDHFKMAICNSKTLVKKLSQTEQFEIRSFKEQKNQLFIDKQSLLAELKQVRSSAPKNLKKKFKTFAPHRDNTSKNEFIDHVIPAYTPSTEYQQKINMLQSEIDQKDLEIERLSELIKTKSDITSFDMKDNDITTKNKRLGPAITYRFVRNINQLSSKYNSWAVHVSFELEEAPIVTDPGLGFIGVDLNYSHVAVSETDNAGKLLQCFNIYFNQECYKKKDIDNQKTRHIYLYNSNNSIQEKLPNHLNLFKLAEPVKNKKELASSHKMRHILGNACQIITNLSLNTRKPIVIEELDFAAKKKELRLRAQMTGEKNTDYNRMIGSFAYKAFHNTITTQELKKGLQVILVNPMCSSIVGLMNYTKDHGMSVHMAASYVIALRGGEAQEVSKKNKKNYTRYIIKEAPKTNEAGYLNYIYRGCVCQLKPIVNKAGLQTQTWIDIASQYRDQCKIEARERRRKKVGCEHTGSSKIKRKILIDNPFETPAFEKKLPNNPGTIVP